MAAYGVVSERRSELHRWIVDRRLAGLATS